MIRFTTSIRQEMDSYQRKKERGRDRHPPLGQLNVGTNEREKILTRLRQDKRLGERGEGRSHAG